MKSLTFSAPMVLAIMDGRKTQTRRVLKPQPVFAEDGSWEWRPFKRTYDRGGRFSCFGSWAKQYAPYAPGDEVYVKEAWSGAHAYRNIKPSERPEALDLGEGAFVFRDCLWYWAAGDPEWGDWEKPRSPIHMPEWASRIRLRITDVRVQQVQEISETDAIAEGCFPGPPHPVFEPGRGYFAAEMFAELWNSIHGPDAWERNDWVAVYGFERME